MARNRKPETTPRSASARVQARNRMTGSVCGCCPVFTGTYSLTASWPISPPHPRCVTPPARSAGAEGVAEHQREPAALPASVSGSQISITRRSSSIMIGGVLKQRLTRRRQRGTRRPRHSPLYPRRCHHPGAALTRGGELRPRPSMSAGRILGHTTAHQLRRVRGHRQIHRSDLVRRRLDYRCRAPCLVVNPPSSRDPFVILEAPRYASERRGGVLCVGESSRGRP